MYVILVGGGKVGYYLTKTLLAEGFEVTLIEKNRSIFEKLFQEFKGSVVLGDGTDIKVLHDAGAGRADLVASVTGYDQDNLVACQLAKRKFGVGRTIARVNNPKNEEILRRLGVDTTLSSTRVIFSLIEQEVAHGGYVSSLTKDIFSNPEGK
ncbi:MAG: TrkA family potassium uptake protein [bacterium]|nr:TrkA family potassium uptake protein [bacterium]